MKYGSLIHFDPIDTIIQIRDADDSRVAQKLIETYVMSDDMALNLKEKVLSQLSLDEVVDNKGILIVGNYGTGKSHLMSVISSIAQDERKAAFLRNQRFAEYIKPLAGRFEVLRIEIGAVKTSLRDMVTVELEKDLAKRGISYKFPPANTITGNKDALNEMMAKFEEVYGQKGYLLVIDELLDYLKSRTQMDLMLDLGFLRELGEFIKNSRFRVICGVQEALFDNPNFTFVAATLLKVKDRFEQIIIRREDIAYVVSERILKKTPEQKAWIREHLQKFCPLYKNMAERLEEFVELFPIHPAYIEIFQKVYLAEKREVLKTISATVRAIIDNDVPAAEPGIKSYDSYWKFIKENVAKKAEPEIKEVLDKSSILEDIINRSFTKPVYKPLAIQIIYALSVHRLTTGSLDVKAGLTVQNLKDDLCLYINMPVASEDFLLSTVNSVMKAVIDTVSGQFIEYNKDNEQYYLDLKKDIDYDAKIEQKAGVLHDSQLNPYFYSLIYEMLDWDAPEYRTGYKIYQYYLNWEEKNICRLGYLFMGETNERPTTQPPRDFYVYFLPPYGELTAQDEKKDDEVFFKFIGDDKFKENLKLFAAAKEMEALAAQQDTKKAYRTKADGFKKFVLKWLDENKTTCFTVVHKGVGRKLPEVLHGRRLNDKTFKEIIDAAASVSLSPYFAKIYPKYPKFLVRVTEKNTAEVLKRGLEYIAGKQYQDGANLLESFSLLENGKIKPENSPYAVHFIKLINKLPANNVLNWSDVFENPYEDVIYDKEFKLEQPWIVLILAALIYSGHVTLLAGNNTRYDASNLEALAKENLGYLYHFKHIGKPKSPAIIELKKLFNILGLAEGLIINPNTWEDGVKALLNKVSFLADKALHAGAILNENFALWGDLLIPGNIMQDYKARIKHVVELVNAVNSRFNTPAKLQNFDYSLEQLAKVEEGLQVLNTVAQLEEFKHKCSANVEYFSKVELLVIDERWKERIREEKDAFLKAKEALRAGDSSIDHAAVLNGRLNGLKDEYIAWYYEQHGKCRLNLAESGRKGEILEGKLMANLRKLTGIAGILSLGKFHELCNELTVLKVCYELSPVELRHNHICPHCHFKPGEGEKPVKGRLDFLENKLEDLSAEWTKTILAGIEDPLVKKDVEYLKPGQKKAMEEFIASRKLPEVVDNNFIEAVNLLLQGLDKVEIDVAELAETMTGWGPSTVDDLRNRFDSLLSSWTRGKDKAKVRLIIKKH
jgi:hypothetical protein